jgi:RNA polymerase sigma-70 factor (ECF subfamily)
MDESARLMLAFRDGDDTAFDALFDRWAGPLLRYLERMVSDAGTAEELVQEAFLRVHGARDRYSHDARFSTWLYRIATNLALNELRRPRRKARHQSTFDDAGAPVDLRDDAPPVEDVVDARRAGAALEAQLDALPERQRMALWLTAVEGFSYAEVAGALETTEKSVKALVHRARSTLASRMRPAGEARPASESEGSEGRERR